MPIIKSAKKALKQSLVRKERNIETKNKYKKAIKKADQANFSEAQKQIDKAAKKNIISKNKAARLKSRIAKKLSAEQSGKTPTTVKTVKKTSKKTAGKTKGKKS